MFPSSLRAAPPQGDVGAWLGVCEVIGPERELETACAETGFANVGEEALVEVLSRKGKPIPEPLGEDVHRRTDLILAAMSAVKPEWTDLEANAAVFRGFLLENPDTYADLHVDPDMLGEVLTAGERQGVHKYALSLAEARAKKDLVLNTRKTRVLKYFKKSKPKKPTVTEKAGPKWVAPNGGDKPAKVTRWIQKYLPSSARIHCDLIAARWRVIHTEAHLMKSVAWTKRGFEKAALEVISWAWEFHSDVCGEQPPFDAKELQKRWKEEPTV